MPKRLFLFLSRRAGDLIYYIDLRHRALTYSNIRTAFCNEMNPAGLKIITRKFYRNFCQNIAEIFFIPSIDKKYMDRYMSFEGLDYIRDGFKEKRGIILAAIHSGSWELSNIMCANFGFPFNLFVRDQRYPRLNHLLNQYRQRRGCKIVQKENQLRQLIRVIKDNESVGLTIDQGGKNGKLVKFFGKTASMATGALKIALRYNPVVIPAFHARIKGPYIKTIIRPPFNLRHTGDYDKDLEVNLQELTSVFEDLIRGYPQDYFWQYKIWKYSKERKILILSDNKAGHLRQSEKLVKIIYEHLSGQGISADVHMVDIKFRSRLRKNIFSLGSCFSGKFNCQGCLRCLRFSLCRDSYEKLCRNKYDIVISCGSSLAALNYIVSRENLAKSFVIMKPSWMTFSRFDLVIMPWHDNPPKRDNVIKIHGALNLIDKKYLREHSETFSSRHKLSQGNYKYYIGLLVGGDSKSFRLDVTNTQDVIRQVKEAADKLDAGILVTTSRRTSPEIEGLVKSQFESFNRCKAMIIANENNFPETIGGILGLSSVLVVSAESISMISEALSASKPVIVFKENGLSAKHKRFLKHLEKDNLLNIAESKDLFVNIQKHLNNRNRLDIPDNDSLIRQKIEGIL